MILYHEALDLLRDHAKKYRDVNEVRIESVAIDQAVGRVLAKSLMAQESSPPFDNSAMDGFVVNAAFVNGLLREGGNQIKVQAMIAAGDYLQDSWSSQCAVEIMTGAPVPHRMYDCVIRIEDVDVTRGPDGKAQWITLKQAVKIGDNIRFAGEDFTKGQFLLSQGTAIHENHLLGLATLGIQKVEVEARVKVAIASTGKEIVPFATEVLEPGKIRNSTGIYLECYLKQRGIDVAHRGLVNDCAQDYIKHLLAAFDEGADVFVSTGAVSMGQFDFVKDALIACGAEVVFHKCWIRPGKPLLFAALNYKGRERFVFGVPGNPVSTAVGLRFFVVPFLKMLHGQNNETPKFIQLEEDVKKPEGFRCFFKAVISKEGEKELVRSLPGQVSFMVSPMLTSNAWVVLPEEQNLIKKGTMVEVCSL